MKGSHVVSDEARKRMSESQKRRFAKCPVSEETRKKCSSAHMGHETSPDTRAKIGNAHRNKIVTQETNAKSSDSHKKWWSDPKNRKRMSDAAKKRFSDPDKCAAASAAQKKRYADPLQRKIHSDDLKEWWKDTENKTIMSRKRKNSPAVQAHMKTMCVGRPCSEETKKKIGISNTGKRASAITKMRLSESKRGDKNPHWDGGRSYEPYCPKWNPGMRRRIRAYFEYQCIFCSKTESENRRKLSCHHVEYNKMACCDGKPVQFAATCSRCHGRTGHDRERWEAMIHRIIDEIWNGRSYFTKDEWEKMNK